MQGSFRPSKAHSKVIRPNRAHLPWGWGVPVGRGASTDGLARSLKGGANKQSSARPEGHIARRPSTFAHNNKR